MVIQGSGKRLVQGVLEWDFTQLSVNSLHRVKCKMVNATSPSQSDWVGYPFSVSQLSLGSPCVSGILCALDPCFLLGLWSPSLSLWGSISSSLLTLHSCWNRVEFFRCFLYDCGFSYSFIHICTHCIYILKYVLKASSHMNITAISLQN